MTLDSSNQTPLSNSEIVSLSYSLIEDCVYFQMKRFCIPFQFKHDLIQDLSLILLEYPNEKLDAMYKSKRINAFCTEVLRRQLFSKTSAFYRKYMRWFKYAKDITSFDSKDINDPKFNNESF